LTNLINLSLQVSVNNGHHVIHEFLSIFQDRAFD
jgi:hypothetical protein